MTHTTSTHHRARSRGFSIIEMLVALSITASLLSASMVALDTAFKGYKMTTDSASTNVVTRIVIHRISTMIRIGTEFGPYPTDVFDPAQNPIVSNFIEFVSAEDEATSYRQITRIEAMPDLAAANGSLVLMLIIEDDLAGAVTRIERPLIRGVVDALFTLQYDVGPVLKHVMIDLTVTPVEAGAMSVDGKANTLRIVTTASPRGY